MSSPKRPALSNFQTQKPDVSIERATPVAEPPAKAKDDRKGMTLRLDAAAWRQLKGLAVEEGRPAHDLLIDAVNDYFRKAGKPPLASYGDRKAP